MRAYSLLISFSFLFLSVSLFSQSPSQNAGLVKPAEYEWERGVLKRAFTDTSGDGLFDYIVTYDKNGGIELEEIDFNHDGLMDDLYYYEGGVITRREIDSNYDSKIDIWIYIYMGKYIQKYQKDANFDGIIDVVKVFGGE